MPPRTLASLAHALTVAPDSTPRCSRSARRWPRSIASRSSRSCASTRGAAMLARPPAAAGDDVDARDARDDVRSPADARARSRSRPAASSSTSATESDEFARLFALAALRRAGWLSVRGLRFDGQLARVARAVRDAKDVRRADGGAVRAGDRAVRARVSSLPRARGARGSRAHARGRHAARARRVRARARASSSTQLADGERHARPARDSGARRRRSSASSRRQRGRARADRGAPTRSKRRCRRRSSSSRRRTSSCTGGASRCARRRARSI